MFTLPKLKKLINEKVDSDNNFLGLLINDYDISIFLYSKSALDGKPSIIFEKTLLFDFELSCEKICDTLVVDKINKTLDAIYNLHSISNKNVIIAIGEKFIKSTSTTVRIKREKQEDKITKAEIENITQKIINKIKNDLELDQQYTQFELLNYNLTHSKIDGYLTKNLVNLKGSNLEISLFSAFCKTEVIKQLTHFCDILKLKLVTITSHLYILEKLLQNDGHENYTIVLFKDNTSDIGIVFGDDLAYTMNTNLGYFTFINFLKESSNLSFEEIQQFLSKEVINEKLTENLKEINTVYCNNLIKKLQKNEKVSIYPSTIIVVAKDYEILDLQLLKERYTKLNLNAEPTILKIENSNLDYIDNYTEIKNKYLPLGIALCKFNYEINNI